MDTVLMALGFLVGILVGLTGVGGGALLTPLLVLVVGVRPSVAIGTDLAFAALSKLAGAGVHLRSGTGNLGLVLRLAVGSVPGALVGAHLVGIIQMHAGGGAETLLTRCLAASLLVAAAASVLRASGIGWSLASADAPGWRAAPLLGFGVGLMVGLTSIGAGSLLMAVLALWYGLSARHAVGADVVHGAVLAAVGALAHAAEGRVDLNVLTSLLVGSLPGVLVGSALCRQVPARPLRLCIAGVLAATAIRML
jgi:uncharacterized membrane protein YfcA